MGYVTEGDVVGRKVSGAKRQRRKRGKTSQRKAKRAKSSSKALRKLLMDPIEWRK